MEFKRLDRDVRLRALQPAEVNPSGMLEYSIYDSEGRLLAERGETLPGADAHGFLFRYFQPHRPDTGPPAVVFDRTLGGAERQDNGPPPRELQITAGTIVRIKTPPGIKESHASSRVIGQLPGRAIFITPPRISGKPLRLLAGETIHLLGFSGKNIFEFDCRVESVCLTPFDYLILDRPENVKRVKLRRSVRVTTRIACWLAAGEVFPGSYTALGMIRDMSVLGASLGAAAGVAIAGDRVHLRMNLRTEDFDMEIRAAATVRNVSPKPAEEDLYIYGLEFETLAPVERLALQCFVNEQARTEMT